MINLHKNAYKFKKALVIRAIFVYKVGKIILDNKNKIMEGLQSWRLMSKIFQSWALV